jgi:hypothetical protein
MSMPRYKAIESRETISAPIRWANSTPTLDLPEAVGPVTNQQSNTAWEVTPGDSDLGSKKSSFDSAARLVPRDPAGSGLAEQAAVSG